MAASVRTLLVSALLFMGFYSQSSLAMDGGRCLYHDKTALAQVSEINDKDEVTVQMLDLNTEVTLWMEFREFPEIPKSGDYVQVDYQELYEGGCNPFIVMKVILQPHLNAAFDVQPEQVYAAAFRLSTVLFCMHTKTLEGESEKDCQHHQSYINQLDEEKKQTLSLVDVKSFH